MFENIKCAIFIKPKENKTKNKVSPDFELILSGMSLEVHEKSGELHLRLYHTQFTYLI